MNGLKVGIVREELTRAYELKDMLDTKEIKYTIESEIVKT